MEDLKTGRAVSRRYRNRRIGAPAHRRVLQGTADDRGALHGHSENSEGNGYQRLARPLFETDDDRLSFMIRLPRHPLSRVPSGEVTGEVERLLRILVADMSRQQLQEGLALRHEDHFRKAYLLPDREGA